EALLAHVLGYVGEISPAQLTSLPKSCRRANSGCPRAGDQVGQGGVELTYDKYLRGQPEIDEVHVNAMGRPNAAPVPKTKAEPGNAIRLTVDISLQRSAERACQYGIRLAHQDQHWLANGCEIVACSPNEAVTLAMA